ncbi:MAG: lipopolysaccharide kinase InaA family protein [Planctomycetota bacterium]
MAQPPAPLPAADAADGAFEELRAWACAQDAAARKQLRGAHPSIWRREVPDLDALQELANHPPATCLKRGKTSTVLRTTLADGTATVLKHYLPTKRLDPRDRMGRSKAIRSLMAAEALKRRGFSVVEALGAWSVAGKGSYLLLADYPDALPMHEAVLTVQGADRAALLANVGRTVRQLHRAGVAYRDLKPSNVLVQMPGTACEDLLFLDHDRNRFQPQAVQAETAMRDLAAVHAGLPPQVRATERLLALRHYDPELLERDCWQDLMPALLQEAAERAHRWIPHRLLGGAPADQSSA